MSSTSNNTISEFEAFAENAGQEIRRTLSDIRGKSVVEEWKMAVIAINKILVSVPSIAFIYMLMWFTGRGPG